MSSTEGNQVTMESETKPHNPDPDFTNPLLGPLLILLIGLPMLLWSWDRWPDVLVDSSRELYVPWQLSEGKVLYRDVAYVQGPLSPYLNSLWFRLFGVGFRTLALCNLVLL